MISVSPEAMGVPLPATRVCSTSCFGAGPAGNVTVGLVLNGPVTLIPVSAMTGESPVVGVLAAGVELVDEGWVEEGLDPADGEPEPDEQAASEMPAATSSVTRAGPPRDRVRATLPIDVQSVVRRQRLEPNRAI